MGRTLRGLIDDAGGEASARDLAGLRWEPMTSLEGFLRSLDGADHPDVVLVSFGIDGVDRSFVEKVVQVMGGPDQVILSAPGASLELAVLARSLGTGQLLREPLDPEELEREASRRAPVVDGIPLSESPSNGGSETGAGAGGPRLVGSSEAMAEVVGTIAEVGGGRGAVLVTGESGTGKELVARAIHWSGPRRDRPFVAINCAAIPEHLLESEFFGHERGAFTGAVARKHGRFERADGGTLLLDEIGDMSMMLQAKILRALEEREVERVGGERPIPVDVRVVAATNQDLEERVSTGEFREDLFYRLAVVRLRVPPLRERMEDLEELVLHFATEFAALYGRELEGIDRQAMRLLESHSWPGNVRELRNVVDRAVRSARGRWIRADDLALGRDAPRVSARSGRVGEGYSPTASLEEVEREHIERVLTFTGGAMGEAARILGIHRNTLTRKVDRYGLGSGAGGEG